MCGRFFSGFAAGSYGILLPLYVGEIASKEIRGSLLSLYQIILNFGEIFVFTFGYLASFTQLNIACGIIPLVYSAIFMVLPESPVFLVSLNFEAFYREAFLSKHNFRLASISMKTPKIQLSC